MPLVGSVAKACTDVKTPERTKNVPSRLNPNVDIASKRDHPAKTPRLAVAFKEWINAVPTSHGISEAFSTGSQNHHPPQPSS